MNVLEKILEEIEERVNFRERLVKYEKRRGTVTDVCRNKGALEELDIVAEIIRSHMDEARDTNVPSSFDADNHVGRNGAPILSPEEVEIL